MALFCVHPSAQRGVRAGRDQQGTRLISYEERHASGRGRPLLYWHRRASPLLLAALLALLAACGTVPRSPGAADTSLATSSSVILVARRGWHIDIGFATADIESSIASPFVDLPSSRFLFFGFGDKHYLVGKHRGFPGILAALWPGPGVLLVTALNAPPEEAFGAAHVIRLRVSPAQARAAQSFVANSVLRQGFAPVTYGEGPYEGSLYLGAAANYSALYTCNTWAAAALRAARLPIRAAGVIFAGQLWTQVIRVDAARLRISAARIGSEAGVPRIETDGKD